LNKKQIRSSFENISKTFPDEDKFSMWENHILEKFTKTEISFRIKFRKFIIFLGDRKEQYVPDLLVEGFEYKEKEIIVEAHEKISEVDIEKYRKFRLTFGSSYYLIMIVANNEVEIWKENQRGKSGGIFNEIYTESEVDELIENIKKWKKDYDEMISEYGQKAECPPPPRGHGCGISAKGFEEIIEIFGYRGKRVQSLCRACRKEQLRDRKIN
jgi:hypothetical protein